MEIEEFMNVVVGCFIIFGVSFVAALTDGPFGIFHEIRAKLKS